MAYRTKEAASSQVQSECEALESTGGLPFRHLLRPEKISEVLKRCNVAFRDRIYTPNVTIWAFLSQVVARKDSSCQDAASRVLADRVAQGKKACSADSNSYCRARKRLPEQVVSDLAREIGQELHGEAPSQWRCKGRRVVAVDGSTATMADTPANQAEYPQSKNQKPGLGSPSLRLVVLVSLAVGTVLECAIGPCRGKKTGEQSLFRQMWDALAPGDIVVGDRLYDAYCDIASLKTRGIDVVFGKKQSRRCDFRRGRRLGRDDHVVVWEKPKYDSSRFGSKEQWEALPASIEMREIRATIRRKGYKTRVVVIVTTLVDAEQYSAQELIDLFAERWHCELDLRSIKQALGMHHLVCKSPEMVRKELWMHLLAYNLIRVRMAQAAAVHGVLPRKLSFTAARNHIHNFQQPLDAASKSDRPRIESELLKAISQCRVGNRPGRKEPRAVKKRGTTHPYLTEPRAQARKGLKA